MADALSFSGIEWDAGNRAKCEGHGVSLDEISRQTTENFFRLFSKVPQPDAAA